MSVRPVFKASFTLTFYSWYLGFPPAPQNYFTEVMSFFHDARVVEKEVQWQWAKVHSHPYSSKSWWQWRAVASHSTLTLSVHCYCEWCVEDVLLCIFMVVLCCSQWWNATVILMKGSVWGVVGDLGVICSQAEVGIFNLSCLCLSVSCFVFPKRGLSLLLRTAQGSWSQSSPRLEWLVWRKAGEWRGSLTLLFLDGEGVTFGSAVLVLLREGERRQGAHLGTCQGWVMPVLSLKQQP